MNLSERQPSLRCYGGAWSVKRRGHIFPTLTQASDIEITAREILKLKHELYDIIATHSGQPIEKVEADSDRDYWMTAHEAMEYGMIDKVLLREKK